MLGESPHLPAVNQISLGPLVLCILVCTCVEAVAGFLTWKATRVSKDEGEMLTRRQMLRAGVAKTNYSATFVENSKLKRLLLKTEKDIEKCQAEKLRSEKAIARIVKIITWGAYGLMLALMWGYPLVSFSPEFLWPSSRMHAFSGGRAAGCVGPLSVVIMFHFGLAPRFASIA